MDEWTLTRDEVNMTARVRSIGLVVLALAIVWVTQSASAQQNPFLGRWSLTSTGEQPAYVGWLDITHDARRDHDQRGGSK